MRFQLAIATVLIAFTGNFSTPAKSQEANELTSYDRELLSELGVILEARAKSKLSEMTTLEPSDIITESLIRSAMRLQYGRHDVRHVSRAAREHVFESYQCAIFEGFKNREKFCHDLRYEETNHVWREPTDRDFQWRLRGKLAFPDEIRIAAFQMRKKIFAVGRNYLKNPENLRLVFDTHLDVILEEYSTFTFSEQQDFRDLIARLIVATDAQSDVELLAHLSEVRQAHGWEGSGEATRLGWSYIADVNSSAGTEFKEWETDVQSIEFIYRRSVDGGSSLVAMYKEILTELQGQIVQK